MLKHTKAYDFASLSNLGKVVEVQLSKLCNLRRISESYGKFASFAQAAVPQFHDHVLILNVWYT